MLPPANARSIGKCENRHELAREAGGYHPLLDGGSGNTLQLKRLYEIRPIKTTLFRYVYCAFGRLRVSVFY